MLLFVARLLALGMEQPHFKRCYHFFLARSLWIKTLKNFSYEKITSSSQILYLMLRLWTQDGELGNVNEILGFPLTSGLVSISFFPYALIFSRLFLFEKDWYLKIEVSRNGVLLWEHTMNRAKNWRIGH